MPAIWKRHVAYLLIRMQNQRSPRHSHLQGIIVGTFLMGIGLSQAAVVTNISSAGVPTGSVNLSTLGTTDWAAWNTLASTGTTIAPFATKNGGIATISNLTPAGVGGAGVRGPSSLDAYPASVFTWSTGDSTSSVAAPADGKVSGVFSTTTGPTSSGRGVQFTISDLPTLAVGQSSLISVMATSFRGIGTLTATATGATPISQTGSTLGETKNTDVFQFSYTPELGSDSIHFTYLHTPNLTGNSASHSPLQAVTISVIPEPSSAFLTLIGGIATLGFRRRKP